jgi:hypothetical protein
MLGCELRLRAVFLQGNWQTRDVESGQLDMTLDGECEIKHKLSICFSLISGQLSG